MSVNNYTLSDEDVKRNQLAELLKQIRELTGVQVKLEDYFPNMPAKIPCMAPECLAAELHALTRLEEMQPGHAKYGVTMRDKLLLYLEAIQRIEDWDPKLLDTPCTWDKWKRIMCMEVERGRRDGN